MTRITLALALGLITSLGWADQPDIHEPELTDLEFLECSIAYDPIWAEQSCLDQEIQD